MTSDSELERIKDQRSARAELGVEAETFMKTVVGRELLRRCKDEQQRIMLTLIEEADLNDVEQTYALRMEYLVAGKALQWLGEIIGEGKAAHQELAQLESNEVNYG